MNFKKAAALFAAGATVVSSLTACSTEVKTEAGAEKVNVEKDIVKSDGSETNGYKFPLETPVEMTMFGIMNGGEVELPDSLAFKKAEELTNVKWDVQSAMGADMGEKKGLLLASGDYPDVFYKAGLTDAEIEKYGKQQIFVPLNDLIDKYAPNLKAYLDERDAWANITSSDGNIYALPNIGAIEPILPKLWINTRWLENVGMEEPKSLDELYNVLKAFKEQDANGNGDPNDEIPLTCTDIVTPQLLMPYFGVTYDTVTRSAEIDGEFVYMPTTDTYKEFIAYTTKLYQEGLLDKNSFVQKHEQQGAIGQSGDVLGSFFDAGSFLTVGRERDDEFKILTPFEENVYPKKIGVNPGALAVTDKCEDPALVVAWADQFYTDEGSRLAWMGVEGESYKVNEDGTWEWLVGNGYGDDISSVRNQATLMGGANHVSATPDIWFSGMTDPDELYLFEESQRVIATGKTYPVLRIAEEDATELATIKTDVDSYIDQYIARVATGELVLEDSWEEYIETMNAMGVERMIEIYQNAYQESLK